MYVCMYAHAHAHAHEHTHTHWYSHYTPLHTTSYHQHHTDSGACWGHGQGLLQWKDRRQMNQQMQSERVNGHLLQRTKLRHSYSSELKVTFRLPTTLRHSAVHSP